MDNDIAFEKIVTLMSHLSDLCVFDGSGKILHISEGLAKKFGKTIGELIGKTRCDIGWVNSDPEKFPDPWVSLAEGKDWQGESLFYGKQGAKFWLSLSATPTLCEGKLNSVVLLGHDITRYKQTQLQLGEALKELEEQKLALDASNIVAITDVKGIITYVNSKFCEISGYSKEELLGQTHKVINSGVHDRAFFANMWQTISRGEVWQSEICNRSKLGSLYWVDTTIVPFLDDQKRPHQYISIRKDITDKKNVESEIEKQRAMAIYSEKMASLGELTAGIAHELGNPLGAMRGRMELLLRQLDVGNIDLAKVHDLAHRSIRMIDRMSKIIKGLRSYTRDATGDPFVKTSLNGLIEDILEFSWEKFRKLGISVEAIGLEKEVVIDCREAEIGQVIVNFINNSCDAIQDQECPKIKIELVTTGDQQEVEIRITDSGSGISEEVKNRMFSPFFTTKPVGHGTGLGLSISKNIIESHHGELSLDESNPNTCFIVRLPCFQNRYKYMPSFSHLDLN